MKKTYWWRIILLSIPLAVILALLVYSKYFCYAYSKNTYCLSFEFEWAVLQPLFILAISVLSISPFLFLVRDTVFLKWLRFAGGYLVLAVLLISATPVSIHSFSPLAGPDRDGVTTFVSELFVIISLIKLAWDSRKGKEL